MANQDAPGFGGRWSDDKLDALKAYLESYGQALKKSGFRLVYIDAFAGAGKTAIDAIETEEKLLLESEVEEALNYRHGSPLIALSSEPAFDEFIFIERNESALTELQNQITESDLLKGRSLRLIPDDANVALLKLANESWRTRRAVAFLDPFALHVNWDTIKALAKTQAVDMWLLFPAMAINRMLPKSGTVPQSWANKLNETFGDEGWKEVFYRTETPDLFGEIATTKLPGVFSKLSEYVTNRLKSEFAGVHKTPLVLSNSSGSPIFLLCFASGNPKGAPIAIRIAQHIINRKNHGH